MSEASYVLTCVLIQSSTKPHGVTIIEEDTIDSSRALL